MHIKVKFSSINFIKNLPTCSFGGSLVVKGFCFLLLSIADRDDLFPPCCTSSTSNTLQNIVALYGMRELFFFPQ